MSKLTTEQQAFWAGNDGDEYIGRNISETLHAANLEFFAQIFRQMGAAPRTVLELGANVGMNYRAIQSLVPNVDFTGVEVNQTAVAQLASAGATAIHSSIEEFDTEEKFDLVLTKGVLIHLNPNSLEATYEKIVRAAAKWIVVAEYYSPKPVGVEYRGKQDLLFKRDFAGEILDAFPNLNLEGYGFAYHRGPFPQDDITWFLLRVV